MAVRGDHGFRYRRGLAIEQRRLLAERRSIEKRPDKFCVQTEVVERDWGLEISILPWNRSGKSLKLGWAIPGECTTTSYEPGRSSRSCSLFGFLVVRHLVRCATLLVGRMVSLEEQQWLAHRSIVVAERERGDGNRGPV
jgi:hypothetical protein